MKSSKHSIHAKLYRFTYTSDLPQNLCPYFWKLVWATIIFVPNFIIQLPHHAYQVIFKKEYHQGCKDHREKGLMWYSALFIAFWYCYGTFNLIKEMFNCYSYDWQAANVGIFFNSALLLLVIIVMIGSHEVRKREKIKKPSIVGEFIKAKYNKLCPKIDWE